MEELRAKMELAYVEHRAAEERAAANAASQPRQVERHLQAARMYDAQAAMLRAEQTGT